MAMAYTRPCPIPGNPDTWQVYFKSHCLGIFHTSSQGRNPDFEDMSYPGFVVFVGIRLRNLWNLNH